MIVWIGAFGGMNMNIKILQKFVFVAKTFAIKINVVNLKKFKMLYKIL